MKKHKLKARLNGQIDYFRNLALERLDANTALRRELAELRTGCNGAIERNVQLVAEFNALEQAHEALNKALEVQGRNASDEYARAQRLRDDVANLQATITNLAKQRDAALARARKSDEMFSRIQALCGSEDV